MGTNDEKASGWGRVFDEIRNPWDWVALLIGAGGGAAAATLLHGVDLGHSIPTGALAAIGARRAAVASFRGRALRKRAAALVCILQRDGYDNLAAELQTEQEKWQAKVTSSDVFEHRLEEVSDEHSRLNRTKLRGDARLPVISEAGQSEV